jgi:hypothetical protein
MEAETKSPLDAREALMEAVPLLHRWLETHVTRHNAEATLMPYKSCYFCGEKMPKSVRYWEIEEKEHSEECLLRKTIELLGEISEEGE